MPSLFVLCQQLGNTRASIALRESLYVYPLIESVHVLALCLFLGLAIILDLRLVGVLFLRTRVSEVAGRLLPWVTGGFAVMAASGVALFFSDPVSFYGNVFFRVKLVMLVLAGLNAFVFHSTVWRQVADWDLTRMLPTGARVAGALSLVLWAGIVVTGRMIAYNWFD